MAEQAINIKITLTDNVTKGLKNVTTGINGLAQQSLALGMQLRQTGRQIGYLGTSIAMLGGTITAPFILALKQAKDHSANVSRAMNDLNNTFINLQVSIAEGILPTITKLINMFSNLVDRFNALSPATREHILQVVFMTGIYLTLGGTIVAVIGRFVAMIGVLVILASKFALLLTLDPILAGIFISIGLISVAMWKWKWVADMVFGIFEVNLRSLQIGLDVLKSALWQIYSWFQRIIEYILKLGALLPNFLGGDKFKKLAEQFKSSADEAQKFANNALNDVALQGKKIENVFTDTGDTWAKVFDRVKGKTIDTIDILKELGALLQGLNVEKGKSTEPQGFFSGFMLGMEESRQKLLKWADVGKAVAADLVGSMQTSFSNFFDDAFTGQLKRAQDYFAEFGKAILRQFSNVLAQMATNWMMFGNMFGAKSDKIGGLMGVISGIAGMFGGGTANVAGMGKVPIAPANYYLGAGAMHSGGIVRAHGGLAIDEVPIIAQSGERVLSRSQNREYEKGGGRQQPTVVVIQAWDTQDIMRNRKSIEAIIINALKGNSGVRGAIKTYA